MYGHEDEGTRGTYNRFLLNTPNDKNVDISIHFMVRSFSFLREEGALGYITTSSATEGSSRKAG